MTKTMQTKTHPWKLTVSELQSRIDHCPTQQQELMRWAYQYSESRNATVADFCGRAAINASTMAKFLAGTYNDPRRPDVPYDLPEHIVTALENFKAALAASAPTQVAFVSTETSRKVFFNCDLARESRSPVFLMGVSQIGKTTAAQKYRDANPDNTTLVAVTSGMGVKGLAVAICEEMGISAHGSLSVLTTRLKKALTRDRLLIVDDFHVLTLSSTPRTFLAAMEFLRAIYNADYCGMIFMTTDLDYTRILKEHQSSLHQLLRRGIHRPHLGFAPLQKDVRAIVEAHGLKWPAKSLLVEGKSPWALIHSLAKASGLKGITERLRYALKLAARATSPVTWHHYMLADSAVASNSTSPADDWS